MAELQVSDQALADLREIHNYIANDNPTAAKQFIDRLLSLGATLAASPRIGRHRPELGTDIRSFPHGRYVVFYRITDSGIEVLHVVHGARDISSLFL